jgi:hypothetical protein
MQEFKTREISLGYLRNKKGLLKSKLNSISRVRILTLMVLQWCIFDFVRHYYTQETNLNSLLTSDLGSNLLSHNQMWFV